MSASLFPSWRLQFRTLTSITTQFQCLRTAATTATLKYFHPIHEITSLKVLYGERDDPNNPMPPYPYGANHNYPEADTGLFGGAKVQSGNKISKGRNKGKTLRRWYPNVRLEKVHSDALEADYTIKITARCLRTINKCGGLDQYLLGKTPARIKELGLLGWRLRWRVLMSPKMRNHLNEERMRLGLDEVDLEQTFEEAWEDDRVRTKIVEQQTKAWNELKEKNRRFEEHMERCTPEKFKKDGKAVIWRQETLMEQSPESIL